MSLVPGTFFPQYEPKYKYYVFNVNLVFSSAEVHQTDVCQILEKFILDVNMTLSTQSGPKALALRICCHMF